MLSIESLQGALQKALAYSNARAASFSPTKDAGGDGEQDFLDGEGNLVDEMVAIDTIRALPEPDRATAIAEATARGSFKALQPFLTAESSGLALMDGCTVNASEEDWSLSPVIYVSRLYDEHRSYGLVKIVPPHGVRPLDMLHKGLAGRRINHCNRQTVTKLADGAMSIDNKPLTSPSRSLADLARHWSDPGSVLPQVRDWRTSEQLLDAAATDSLWRGVVAWTPDMVEKAEKLVWESLESGLSAEYSSENEFTSYPAPGSSASARWNLRDLGDALSMVRTRHRVIMPGINTAFTYFGAAGSAFPFHKEDYDLASVNVHCLGAPKIWYSIHEADVSMFEEYAANEATACPYFLRHKRFLFHPRKLADAGIRVFRTVQMPGDHIVTFPLGYHGGINLGFNVNEAINIAPHCWPEHAVKAVTCDETGHVGNAGAARAGYAIFAKYLGFVREQCVR